MGLVHLRLDDRSELIYIASGAKTVQWSHTLPTL